MPSSIISSTKSIISAQVLPRNSISNPVVYTSSTPSLKQSQYKPNNCSKRSQVTPFHLIDSSAMPVRVIDSSMTPLKLVTNTKLTSSTCKPIQVFSLAHQVYKDNNTTTTTSSSTLTPQVYKDNNTTTTTSSSTLTPQVYKDNNITTSPQTLDTHANQGKTTHVNNSTNMNQKDKVQSCKGVNESFMPHSSSSETPSLTPSPTLPITPLSPPVTPPTLPKPRPSDLFTDAQHEISDIIPSVFNSSSKMRCSPIADLDFLNEYLPDFSCNNISDDPLSDMFTGLYLYQNYVM